MSKKLFAMLLTMLPCLAHAEQAASEQNTNDNAPAWAWYGQFTGVSQAHPGYNSAYQGTNSLSPHFNTAETTDLTLYAGMRVGSGGELWLNPELDQGYGLSNTVGIAGFSSGEAYKVGANSPYLRLPRAFYRQTINLGGAEQNIASSANQMAGNRAADNFVVTVGKFSVVDIFDTNRYAHDPRADFLNWSIVDAGAFDYAADAWGFSKGGAVEWTSSRWTVRGGFFDLSQIPNDKTLDQTFTQHEWVSELEERHEWRTHPGKIKLLSFINQGNMGSYADAVNLGRLTNSTPNTSLVRRYGSQSGYAVNIEQELAADMGVFARASKNQGNNEAFEFTEINQSLSAGFSLHGDRWARHDDTVGFAAVANGLSGAARSYFAAGGIGILIGDGQLPHYGAEKIMETYYAYAVRAVDHLTLTVNYQYVMNPAYNQDRGPVSIIGARVHLEF